MGSGEEVTIVRAEGVMTLNNYKMVSYTGRSIEWAGGGQQRTWSRVTPVKADEEKVVKDNEEKKGKQVEEDPDTDKGKDERGEKDGKGDKDEKEKKENEEDEEKEE